MNEILTLAFAWVAGGLLGAVFFGGLWWTVRKGATSKQPALWFFSSMSLRMIIALVGFYFIGSGDWKRLLICLLGFLVARSAVTWLTRSPIEKRTRTIQETSHAP